MTGGGHVCTLWPLSPLNNSNVVLWLHKEAAALVVSWLLSPVPHNRSLTHAFSFSPPAETRALRRALTKSERSVKTLRQKKARSLYPHNLRIVVKA